MRINTEISVGNVVSWTLIILGATLALGSMKAKSDAAVETANQAAAIVITNQSDMVQIRIAVGRLEEKMNSLDGKAEEIRRYIIQRSGMTTQKD